MAHRLDKKGFGNPIESRQEEAETEPKSCEPGASQARVTHRVGRVASIQEPHETAEAHEHHRPSMDGGEGGHDHSGGHGHDDHGGHGESDYPAESVTIWTDKAELFVEWDALTVGRESRFLAHITDMGDPEAFKAVAAGTVTVTLAVEGQEPRAFQVEEPARLGIFIPALTPVQPGPCKLTISLVLRVSWSSRLRREVLTSSI